MHIEQIHTSRLVQETCCLDNNDKLVVRSFCEKCFEVKKAIALGNTIECGLKISVSVFIESSTFTLI